ncbi:MAG: hypothetical protein IT384_10025 [Deltaproteobacteria bacterium]|nr:hypothetical protein [Deltaproteobacteria bacterium]
MATMIDTNRTSATYESAGDYVAAPLGATHEVLDSAADTMARGGHDGVRAASEFLNGTPAPRNRLLRIPADAVVGATDLAVNVGGHTAVGAAAGATEIAGGIFGGLGKLFGGIVDGIGSLFSAAAPETKTVE